MWLFEPIELLSPIKLPLPPTTEAGCIWSELPLVVQEQFFRRLVGYVYSGFSD